MAARGLLAAALLATTLISCSPRAASAAPVDPCASAYMIVARGTNEPPGEGHTATLVAQIKRTSKQPITDVPVEYPAVAKNLAGYIDSTGKGDTAVEKMLTDAVGQCPNRKIVMLGYSQGAQIIGDGIAGGGGGKLGPRTPPVPRAVSNHVVAVVQMGDPRHMAGQPFDVGTSTHDGRFPRAADQLLTPFASKIRSYCDTGDPFCDSGRTMSVHFTYLLKYSNNATRFVVNAIGG